MPGLIATKTRPSQRKLQAQQQLQQIQLQPPQRGRAASPSMQHIEQQQQQQQQQQQNASTRAPAGLRLSSAAASSMRNALVSLVLVVLCAAAYMHFFQLSVSTVNIQSIIDQRVKEAGAAVGGPQYVTRLHLVSASASNMKRENQR